MTHHAALRGQCLELCITYGCPSTRVMFLGCGWGCVGLLVVLWQREHSWRTVSFSWKFVVNSLWKEYFFSKQTLNFLRKICAELIFSLKNDKQQLHWDSQRTQLRKVCLFNWWQGTSLYAGTLLRMWMGTILQPLRTTTPTRGAAVSHMGWNTSVAQLHVLSLWRYTSLLPGGLGRQK